MINYKLFTGVVDKRYLQQVCCLDNVGSGTQGAIWADTVHKQVSVINLYFGKSSILNRLDRLIQEYWCYFDVKTKFG